MPPEEKLTTIRVKESTQSELIKIKGSISADAGQNVTYDDAIWELIRIWRQNKR